MKAPSHSNTVSRETMIENIKDEYSTFEDIDNFLIPNVEKNKDIFSKPLGVDRKKEKLDMLFSDVSVGIKKGSSNNDNDDEKESSKNKKKKSFFGFLSSLFSSIFSLLVKFKELVFLLVLLLLLLFSTRKPSKKKNN